MKTIRKRGAAVLVAALLTLVIRSADAVLLTNGTLSVSNGAVFATEEFTNNFSISYSVSQIGTQITYAYTLFVPLKNLSHWNLGLSTNFTSADLISFTSSIPATLTGPQVWTPDSSSQQGMPDDLFGYKINPGGTRTGQLTFTFVTDRLPTNGNFYAKDGNGVYAFNTGFSNPSSGAFLIVPDSVGVNLIPEPRSLLLAAGGTLLVLVLRRRS